MGVAGNEEEEISERVGGSVVKLDDLGIVGDEENDIIDEWLSNLLAKSDGLAVMGMREK